EIKGVYREVKDIKEPETLHLAQAMCYAYMVLTDEGLDEISVIITYCQIGTEVIKRFHSRYDSSQLTEWFEDLIEKYKPWAIYEYDHRKKRDISISKLKFPYSYRPGQDDLAAFTYEQIISGGRLFIEAPTGVGKTITTIYPSVRAMGEGKAGRIFYLTAKTITRSAPEDCFALLEERGLIFKPVTITAKEKLCIMKPESQSHGCDPDICERAKGHYDRINDALYDMLTNEEHINRQTVLSYAGKHCVCPFELSLDAALFADAIICDYNYVFDPNVYLRRFFSAGKKGDMILLIDEAHNLVERGRQMYSAVIKKEDFLLMARLLKKTERSEKRSQALKLIKALISAAESVNKELLGYKRQCEGFREFDDINSVLFKLMRFAANYEAFAYECPELIDRETFPEIYFSVRYFLETHEYFDDKYRIYADYDDEGAFLLHLQCMDPSGRLKEVLDRALAGIFFSATLLPIRYYKEQLGGESDDPAVYARSAFSPENRSILIARDVTSLYKSRGPAMYERIAGYIERFIRAKNGNYLIFFPSYAFMQEVASYIDVGALRVQSDPGGVSGSNDTSGSDEVQYAGYEVLIQGKQMKEGEREEFLNRFRSGADVGVVGFCVMGGIFSEGIDLTGDRLIGAAIVGTGLPMVCEERELYRRYFEEMRSQGFDYAYLYPGLGKVFQAGGRVIRTESDRGVILLLDERFLRNEYRREFPREWSRCRSVTIDTVENELKDFWNGK
ncbi:MAG: ATP-dependent DNA helicase, partial [Eubacterium sp.]|nr:ATP-dependent DNA helicase [Eubacterium sp.]